VLPHFRAIENDLDFDTPVHGSDGPILVRRVSDFDGCTASFVRSATEAGFDWIGDLNGGTSVDSSPGVGAVPLNINGGTRVGPGGAYLQPAINRTNLTLLTSTRVRRVRIVNDKAVGVDCMGSDGAVDLTADRIVLCAGAISSAHLLMLSGIGPRDMLRSAGVPVVVDLPVGASFVDHPEWVLPVDWSASHGLPPLEAVLTTADGLEIRPYTAGFGAMVSGRRDDPADRPHIGVTLMQPKSRGALTLTSADPDVPPLIDHHYDSEPDDVAALTDGADLARELASPTTDVGAVSWSTSQHLSSTAPMGVGDGAVLDPQCRVRGIDRLWVVDGSVLPTITSRGPHATVVMIGHRAAEFVT
jgi:predicted dehydrogenase (TIGR03970 family)